MHHRNLPSPRRHVDAWKLAGAEEADHGSADRRLDSRQAAHQHVAMRFRAFHLICDLIDLSESGAKVRVLDGMVPNTGEIVALTLFDGAVVEARVAGLRDKFVALKFARPISEVSERLDFESLGRAYFGKAVALQKSARR